MKCNIIVSAAKSHSSQGRVERKIGLIKDLLSKLGKESFLMSFLNWETAFAQISNHLNNLPVCRASGRSVYAPEFTVLTPNRLLLGRNNQRGLSGPMFLDASPSNIIERINQAQKLSSSFYLTNALICSSFEMVQIIGNHNWRYCFIFHRRKSTKITKPVLEIWNYSCKIWTAIDN